MNRTLYSALVVVMLAIVLCGVPAQADNTPSAKGIGLTLLPLAPEDLDAIQRATRRRVGVMVSAVARESLCAKAGIKKGDIILALGSTGVDSPEAVDRALSGKAGKLDVGILRISPAGEPDAIIVPLELPMAESKEPRPTTADKTRPDAGDADTRSKLKALEDARAAGVLTEEEYKKKKAELEAKLKPATKPLNPETQKKLKALEDARKAGVLSEAEFERKRTELLGTGAAKRAKAADKRAPLIPSVKSTVYEHPIGFRFVHPSDWRVEEQGEMLVLTPPNQAKNAQGPIEAYLIAGERVDSEGINSASDPMVVSFLDEQVRQLLPNASRKGDPAPVDTSSGKGVVLEWLCKGPNGQDLIARCYANVIKGHGVVLSGIGVRSNVEARDGVLRRMFSSFGMQEGKIDPALVGEWALSGTTSITNWSQWETAYSRAKLVSDSKTRLTLSRDGTWKRVYESQTLAGGGGIWMESNDRKVSQGRWFGGGGMLYLVDDQDLWETYRAKVEGQPGERQLRMASEKTGTLWSEAR